MKYALIYGIQRNIIFTVLTFVIQEQDLNPCIMVLPAELQI